MRLNVPVDFSTLVQNAEHAMTLGSANARKDTQVILISTARCLGSQKTACGYLCNLVTRTVRLPGVACQFACPRLHNVPCGCRNPEEQGRAPRTFPFSFG